jgi:hypothetical protein
MKVGDNIRYPPSPCTNCGAVLDTCNVVDRDTTGPSRGDVTVCLECGHVMVFGKRLRLRDPKGSELKKIAGDKRLIAAQRAIAIGKARMSDLFLGKPQIEAITAAVARARARPIPWGTLKPARPRDQESDVVTLADREEIEAHRPPAEQVLLPLNYRLCVSFEEQPAGMCMHVSMSVNEPGRLPPPAASAALMQICMHAVENMPEQPDGRTWIEEFLIDGKPGGLAFNALVIVAPNKEGHA